MELAEGSSRTYEVRDYWKSANPRSRTETWKALGQHIGTPFLLDKFSNHNFFCIPR